MNQSDLDAARDSHSRSLILSDSRLESDCLADLLQLIQNGRQDLTIGRLSVSSQSQLLDRLLVRIVWLSLKYPLTDSHLQTLLQLQRQSQNRLQRQDLDRHQRRGTLQPHLSE